MPALSYATKPGERPLVYIQTLDLMRVFDVRNEAGQVDKKFAPLLE